MKKLLAIIVLGLFWSGNANANSLIGKKLECNYSDVMWKYFEFKNKDMVQSWLYTHASEPVKFRPKYYDTSVGFITIYPSKKKDILKIDGMIDRETLYYKEDILGYNCKIITENIDELLKKRLEIDSEQQKNKNKI